MEREVVGKRPAIPGRDDIAPQHVYARFLQ